MSTEDRPRRPIPERTAPIRDWRTLLDGAAPEPDRDRRPGPEGPASEAAARLTGAVARSVELGYRVIDDHLQQGQRVARRLSSGRPAPEVLATEIQDLGVRMARYASDFMAAWMELLELTARGTPPPEPRAHANDGPAVQGRTAPANPPPTTTDRVRVALRSARPVAVDVDYHPERVTGPNVRVHALRSLDPDTPRIDTVSFRPGSGDTPPTLVVHVDAAPPAGRYEGLLIDSQSNRPVGHVRLVIGDLDGSGS